MTARNPSRNVQLNILAAETATQVDCPHCGQPAGATCVTTGLNEAAFTHSKRLKLRRAQLD